MGQETLRIAVVGAGAIGCRVAAHLAQQGIDTTLFDNWSEHVQAVNRDGLTLEQDASTYNFRLKAYTYEAAQSLSYQYDIVLLAVRSDETNSVLPLVARLLSEDGCVISCQNGINEDAIAQVVGAQRTLGCSLVLGARLVGPGRVRALQGADTLRVGEFDGQTTERVHGVAHLLGACGTATITNNLLGYRWMKLVLNATGNPLLLLSGLKAQELHADRQFRCLIIALAREVLATATALDVAVEPVLAMPIERWLAAGALQDSDLHHCLAAHGDALGSRRLSMAADFETRGRTEVDHINGYVIAKSLQLGRSVPLNTQLLKLVKALEEGQLKPQPEALASLLALVPNAS